MNDIKQNAKKLFQFLKAFNKLKIKPQLDVNSFEKILWFHEIPKEKECTSIIHKIDSEKFNKDSEKFKKWIEVKKPKRRPYPDPPKEIKPWLKNDTLDKYTKQPHLFSYIIVDSLKETEENTDAEIEMVSTVTEHALSEAKNQLQELKSEIRKRSLSESSVEEKYDLSTDEALKKSDKISLEDRPEIKRIFENYLNQEWIPWSKEEKRLESVSQVYDSLYEIYKKNKYQGEIYQIILGLGFLSSKNERGRDVKRHIVTTPLSIDFNSVTGTITVGPCEQSTELSLEMDMLRDSEKPKNCDEINSQLSNLSNDFWIDKAFDNCLKSWLNSYDSNGQFIKSFDKPVSGSFTTLSICPAVILRKRNERNFLKFYSSVLEDIEKGKTLNHTCLNNLIEGKPNSFDNKANDQNNGNSFLDKKHYFPLLANEEQKKIIEKISFNNQVVVQGPPGTGKTHSIANLICHFLAEGQKVLVTSQTDRALKVLKNKLPKEIKPLCVEILGKDQNSFQELKSSFEVINSNYQSWNKDQVLKDIDKLEKKDNDLTGKLATVNAQLTEIKNSETKKFEKLFDFYEGTLADISTRVKHEEEKYQWIKANFSLGSYNKECPISDNESLSLLRLVRELKTTEDSMLEESIEFTNQIFTVQQFKEKAQRERAAKTIIEKYEKFIITSKANSYKSLKNNDLVQLQQSITSLYPKIESLLNRNEKWVKQALNDCLADRDREWRYLYNETNMILDKNKDIFTEAERIYKITINPSIPTTDLYLTNLLKDFFEKYKPNDKVRWGFLCSKTVRNLKKIKINGRCVSSYEDVKKFKDYVTAKRALEKINNLWIHQGINITGTNNRNFGRNYHVFKDFCEPLSECLSIHKLLEYIKDILSQNNISQPQWTFDSVQKERDTVKFVIEKKTLKILLDDFKRITSSLNPYKNQKNQIARKIISIVEDRNLEAYKKILDEISIFQKRKKYFDEICQIRDKLQNDIFYLKLKKEADSCQWEERLKYFEKAWAWQRADLWLEEKTSNEFHQRLNQNRKDLLIKKKQNMEKLASTKAWFFCLNNITDKELSSLRALIQAIIRIGKGMGKSAPRHRKIAKQRMEECKPAIPAWIMPLYRVVENISPDTEPFDIAIIDEASQTGPDGFLLNYLAKKIIVVGDKEQISPEHPGMKEEDVEILKKTWLSDIIFSDHIGRDYSYYDYCEILFIGSHVQLREHFRCMPEIIQFSNQISYKGIPLIPLRQYGASRLPPLKKTLVADAVSKIGSGRHPQNEKEAQAIVDQIQKCIREPAYKGKTFGIISLQGKPQVKVIEEALLQINKEEIEKRIIQVGNAYDFQGDERDVIFLSMAIAKDWNTSALTRETYKRQYNVAASRAKDQMWLFHSVEINDLLNPEDFRRKLLNHFLPKQEISKTIWTKEKLQELYKKIKETINKNPGNAP